MKKAIRIAVIIALLPIALPIALVNLLWLGPMLLIESIPILLWWGFTGENPLKPIRDRREA